MKEILVTTLEQLNEIVQCTMQKCLPVKSKEPSRLFPDTCSTKQAIKFLTECDCQFINYKMLFFNNIQLCFRNHNIAKK